MENPPTKKRKFWFTWATAFLAIVVAHFFVAPATVHLKENLQTRMNRWRGVHQEDVYMSELRSIREAHRWDLVPCVTAFRDFLATRNIKLHILLRPSVEDLLEVNTKTLHKHPTEGALALQAAEASLAEAGIPTVNLLPDMYREACLNPKRPVIHPDLNHLSDDMVLVMTRTFCSSLDDSQKASSGSTMLLVGDCYAFLTATRLKQRMVMPKVRSKWKNNADSQMAYEFSCLPPEHVSGVREIYWFISSACVKTQSAAPLPFPAAQEPAEITPGNVRVVLAEITRLSKVPSSLGQDAPYANALAAHECVTTDGERFLAIVPVMQNKQALPAQRWTVGQKLLISMQQWDAATRAMPTLSREEIFDDVEHYTLYRYYVTGWGDPPQMQAARAASIPSH